MKILGLDISSSTIGWALIESEKEKIDLIDYGFIKPPKKEKGGMSFRLDDASKQVIKILQEQKPDFVAAEDYARKFQEGRSSASTITILTAFNEVVCLCAYQYNNLEPDRLTVANIRSLLGKFLNIKTISKDDVFGIICSEFSENQTKNFLPTKNKVGNIKKEYGDVSDAIAVAIAFSRKKV